MRAIFMCFAVALFLSVSSTATDHLENDFKGLFLKHWQVSKVFTLAVAEAMPAESYSFKPNPQEMSFSEIMINLAHSNSYPFRRVARTTQLTNPAGYDTATSIRFIA